MNTDSRITCGRSVVLHFSRRLLPLSRAGHVSCLPLRSISPGPQRGCRFPGILEISWAASCPGQGLGHQAPAPAQMGWVNMGFSRAASRSGHRFPKTKARLPGAGTCASWMEAPLQPLPIVGFLSGSRRLLGQFSLALFKNCNHIIEKLFHTGKVFQHMYLIRSSFSKGI